MKNERKCEMENANMQEIQKYQQEATQLEEHTASIVIKNDQQVVGASEFLQDIKTRLAKFQEFFSPIVTAAHQAHKTAKDRENLVCKPLERAAKLLSDRVAQYQWNKEQQQQEQERLAKIAADKKTEEKQEGLVEKAAEAEKNGDHEKASHYMEKAEETYVAPAPVAAAVKTNTSVRVIHEPEVIDQRLVPEKYKTVDLARIKRIKAADKTFECPGVKFRPRPVGSTRVAS